MKKNLLSLVLIVWACVYGTAQITDSYFDKVNYVGAFGKSDWTQGWSNFNPNQTIYPTPTVTIGNGASTPGVAANEITTDTRWSSSNSPLVGNASFSNANLSNSFFEQVNFVGAFGTYDWTQGWANFNPQSTVYPSATVVVPAGHITTNTTWTNTNTYLLNGWVYVDAGATLTIQPGTIIRGDLTNQGALIIERGGKLMAEGTAAQPIVFTSNSAAGARNYGDWGGVIICGRATINPAGGEAQIEGGVGSYFGGGSTPNDADNSGTLKYVRIEFPGIAFSANNEINGLTMGGVGSGTTIDYVQVSYSGDDSFEWFGGTVNSKHLVAFRGWDDEFDTDFGFKGLIQFAVSLRDPAVADVSGSNGFESDNDASGSTNTPSTHPIFSNVSIFGPLATPSTPFNSNFKRALHLRRNTTLCVYNSVFSGFPVGLYIDGNNTQANANSNLLQMENCIMAGMTTNFDVPSGQTWNAAAAQTWYNDPSRHNQVLSGNAALTLVDPFNLTAPNFLPAKTIYKIDGWIYVKNNATLTIDPGTILRGDKTNRSALIIERGSKLNAIGTATEPIIFTSGEPAGARANGDWGGVILCGNATVNLTGGQGTIEGGVGSLYGGTNDADNSGSLKYVRIEYPGYAFAANNEINGLTMGGVGSGTSIDYVQVSYSNDDSYEWFGGTVNAKHLVAFAGLDDDFDTDNGFRGKVQFAVTLRDPNLADISGSNSFESDNNAAGDALTPLTNPTFSNVSSFGPQPTVGAACNSNYKRSMHLRRNTNIDIHNSIFLGWPVGLYIDGNNTMANANANNLQIENSFLAGMATNFAVPSGQTWSATDEQNWFLSTSSPDRNNATYTTAADLQIIDGFNLTSPNFLPLSSSPVWGASVWSRTVTGALTYDNTASTPLNSTTVYLKTQAGTILETATTDASGNFLFNTIDGVYVLDANTTKSWGGVGLPDVIQLRRFIASQLTPTALQFKAGDVNKSSTVTVADVVYLRQKIALLNPAQWTVSDYVYDNPTVTISGSGIVQNIKALCGGDVNNSYVPAAK
ncbi:MAG: dockerin type I repeat-containing protein [Bacteroidales bacterium]|nr:dockerin type I repeat-containing protein [Bacteroidales bacterium]